MLCKLHLGVSGCGCDCMTPRKSLLSWGYLKIVAAILLSPLTNEPIYKGALYDPIDILTFVVLLVLLITDVIFHAILVTGARKANVKLLEVYRKYVKVLWVVTIVITVIYILMVIFDIGGYYYWYEFYPLATFIYWYLTLLIQSCIVLIVNREINNITGNHDLDSNNTRDYTTEYTFKIEISGNKKVVSKEEDKDDTTNKYENIDTAYDKAILVT